MSLEGMPLSDLDIELFSKILDGQLTREEALALFKKETEEHKENLLDI